MQKNIDLIYGWNHMNFLFNWFSLHNIFISEIIIRLSIYNK